MPELARRDPQPGLWSSLGRWHGLGGYVPGVEARQLAVLQREGVVQPHKLHEHVGDQNAQVLDVARLIADGHYFGVWVGLGSAILLVVLLLSVALGGARDSGRLRGHPRLRLLRAFRGGYVGGVGEGLPPLGCPRALV